MLIKNSFRMSPDDERRFLRRRNPINEFDSGIKILIFSRYLEKWDLFNKIIREKISRIFFWNFGILEPDD